MVWLVLSCSMANYFRGTIHFWVHSPTILRHHLFGDLERGGFLKWWYPPFHTPQVLIIFSRKKPTVVGESHHFRKPPHDPTSGLGPAKGMLVRSDQLGGQRIVLFRAQARIGEVGSFGKIWRKFREIHGNPSESINFLG